MNETAHRPGRLRVLALLVGLAARRWINRLGMAMATRRKPGADIPVPRRATPRKRTASGVMLAALAIGMLFNSFFLAGAFVKRLVGQSSGQELVSGWMYDELERAATRLHDGERIDAMDERAPVRNAVLKVMREELAHDPSLQRMTSDQRAARVEVLVHRFQAEGINGFCREDQGLWPLAERWPAPAHQEALVSSLGALFLFLSLVMMLMAMGGTREDLGKVEWSLEWFFTLPISARALFAGKILERTLVNPLCWFLLFPVALMTFVATGIGWWSLPVAIAVTLYLGTLQAACCLVSETWLRLHISVAQLKNLQALLTLMGTVALFMLLLLATRPVIPAVAMEWGARFVALYNPFSVPLALSAHGSSPWLPLLAMACFLIILPWGAVELCRHMVRRGLMISTGNFQGVRGAASPAARIPWLAVRGALGKDLRLLLRDRNFLVQALIVPVLIIGMQVAVNPTLVESITHNFTNAAAFAFSLGAYVLMSSAMGVLSVEGNALWMLYAMPRPLHRVLIEKTVMWAACAAFYAVMVLIAAGWLNPNLSIGAVADAAMVISGVVIYAFIAAGLGALATDPLETEVKRRISAGTIYLYLFLSGLFAYAIYSPSIWGRLVQLALSALLAFALWQKVRDRIPFLLDPTQMPPPRISLSDGLIAVLAFFVIQGLCLGMLGSAGWPLGASVAMAFVVAGTLVAGLALLVFWRQHVPDLLRTVGLRAGHEGRRGTVGSALAAGLLAGGVAAGVGAVYTRAIEWIAPLRELREQVLDLAPNPDLLWWIAGLAVFAAPPVEEFIFRGLVFRGLRRSLSPGAAALASAAIFAIVHPPLSAAPVFVLGVVAALAFEYSGLLLAPILAHMTYNLVIVMMGMR